MAKIHAPNEGGWGRGLVNYTASKTQYSQVNIGFEERMQGK